MVGLALAGPAADTNDEADTFLVASGLVIVEKQSVRLMVGLTSGLCGVPLLHRARPGCGW